MLVQTIHVFSEDMGMEFGIDECAIIVTNKGKIMKSVGIELPDGKVVKLLLESERSNFGISEANRFLGEGMRLKVSKEYFRR